MNIFIIGNASSVWMREYIRAIHVKHDDTIYLTVYETLSDEYVKEYNKMGVQLVPLGIKGGVTEKINKMVRLLGFVLRKSKREHFDIIEIQSPPHNFQAYIIALCLKLAKCKAFLMFWGSDILDITPKDAKRLEHIVKKCNVINKPGLNAYNAFVGHFGEKYAEKFTHNSLRFGTLALPYINEIATEEDSVDCKRKLGLNPEKIAIAVGYNGKKRQQHLKVINELVLLSDDTKNKMQLVYHLVGCDESYKKEIENESRRLGFEYKIIDEMLNFNQIAVLRNATDVFIHAQTTDGLSGTIRECLYSEVVVINPAWIPYEELKKIGVEYVEYNEFSELSELINKYIDGSLNVDIQKNKQAIHDNYSWEALYEEWIDVFKNMR